MVREYVPASVAHLWTDALKQLVHAPQGCTNVATNTSTALLCEFEVSASMHGRICVQAELKFLGALSHPNLVRLYGYGCDGTDHLLVYEFVPNRSLDYHLFAREDSSLRCPTQATLHPHPAPALHTTGAQEWRTVRMHWMLHLRQPLA